MEIDIEKLGEHLTWTLDPQDKTEKYEWHYCDGKFNGIWIFSVALGT